MIYIYLPFLPPSMNHMYDNIPRRKVGNKFIGGGRRLTNSGKKFKNDVKQVVLKHHATQTGELNPSDGIGIYAAFGFPNLFNKGYPEKTDARYKKLDVSNRRKALDDGLAEVINIDDSQIVYTTDNKYLSEIEETHIWIWNEDVEKIGARLTQSFASIAGLTTEEQQDRALPTVPKGRAESTY
jgi:Holliday junction resolvase RusA-like endonuclease